MSASKLKNIALLILLLTNLFLLGQVLMQENRSARYHEAALDDAIAILAESGITVRREVVPKEPLPVGVIFYRDRAAEESFAAALLGADVRADTSPVGAVPASYSSPSGTLHLYSDGTFDAVLTRGAHPLGGEPPEEYAPALLRRLGIEVESSSARFEGADTVIDLFQMQDGRPIFACTIRLQFRDDSLVALSGRRLTGPPTSSEGASLSPATLLLRFHTAIRARGDVCSELISIEPGYDLSAAFTGPNRLIPVLLLTTDGGRAYYLNIETGELRTA